MSSTTQKFSSYAIPIQHLIQEIDMGVLGLPDLQRPFVWDRTKVRDLFDSLYQGFPTGYFLFWKPSKDVDNHSIGVDTIKRDDQKMIVDGQQRLTSLYAVIKGKAVETEDNDQRMIKIAFNPLTEEFMVANASSDNNPEFINNISSIWSGTLGTFDFVNNYISKLSQTRDLSDAEKSKIASSIQRLDNVQNYQFSVLELSSTMDVDVVAEVFQRINSKGVPLNSADFILTLMSVYWVEGRHQLEDFSSASKHPATDGKPSPYNPFISPSPDQMLRVTIGLGLKRGVLQNAYQVLRGRDPKTREVSEDLRDKQFAKLKSAQEQVLNLTSWHEYITCVKSAGFRSRHMISSSNNFLYGYLLYLIGKNEYYVPHDALRNVIARWVFMSSLTGRYTSSPESVLEADLRRLEGSEKSAAGFIATLDNSIANQLTDDFWKVTLPENLSTSSAFSPYLFGYYAALNLLGATALFSNMKISDLLDPNMTPPKSPVERHHLYPKAYLRKLGFSGVATLNQIANYAFVEWADNLKISDNPPSDYFPEYFDTLNKQQKADAIFWHALPDKWTEMEYWDFIRERQRLISFVVREGYGVLTGDVIPSAAAANTPSVEDLLHQMETLHVEFKASARKALDPNVPEKVVNDNVIKTVAAFLNTKGGTLGIGISDDGDILGIQADLDYKNHDVDQYQNWLTTLLMQSIGEAVVTQNVSIRFETQDGQVVCLVDVKPSKFASFAKVSKGDNIFFVRSGNTTRVLEGKELMDYTSERF